jgi:hypothetical protein
VPQISKPGAVVEVILEAASSLRNRCSLAPLGALLERTQAGAWVLSHSWVGSRAGSALACGRSERRQSRVPVSLLKDLWGPVYEANYRTGSWRRSAKPSSPIRAAVPVHASTDRRCRGSFKEHECHECDGCPGGSRTDRLLFRRG